jgi:hypothetical protein
VIALYIPEFPQLVFMPSLYLRNEKDINHEHPLLKNHLVENKPGNSYLDRELGEPNYYDGMSRQFRPPQKLQSWTARIGQIFPSDSQHSLSIPGSVSDNLTLYAACRLLPRFLRRELSDPEAFISLGL